MEEHYGIVPPTGVYGKDWPSGITPTLPQGIHGELSKGGWSKGNEGFVQQTFLGASISNFNISAGFGSSSTTLSVSLVNDEYNKSDETGLGQGDDVYHNGREDSFRPPVVGSPVYFKFGKNHATLDQAYRRTYNLVYGSDKPTSITLEEETIKGPINSIPENYFLKEERPISQDEEEETVWEDQTPIKDPSYDFRGYNHFVFGGILANYTKDEGSSRTFSASVADPREILSNVQVILNDYQGTVFNNKNILNVYGFLEYDRSKELENQMDANAFSKNLITRDANGFLIGGLPNPLTGEPTADCYLFEPSPLNKAIANDPILREIVDTDRLLKNPCLTGDDFSMIHNIFPVTGQGMSRRCKQGIPWYRVYQALKSMMYWTGYDFGFAPCEYTSAGFGGVVDFRGFNYLVDLSGLPLHKIPQMYFLDTDQIDLLSLIQDVCQAISHDYVVSLLPVLDSPRTRMLYQYNRSCVEEERFGDIVTGIIRVDAIDKTVQPQYGTVTEYIENLEENGTLVETKNIGFETTNVTTDRFIAGHQEVSMYVFSSHKDSEFTNYWDDPTCWTLNDSLSDQIVPFFGYLDQNEEVPTIPKGNGPFKQIVLNTQGLDAFGVGDYYVATEIELRAASIGFENWCSFLMHYDQKYAEILPRGRSRGNLGDDMWENAKEYADEANRRRFPQRPADYKKIDPEDWDVEVIVPRCIWPSERNYMFEFQEPASPCSPPYGYPLYYQRASMIGVNNQRGIDAITKKLSTETGIDNTFKKFKNDFNNLLFGDHVQLNALFAELIRDNWTGGNNEKGITNKEALNFLKKIYKKKFGKVVAYATASAAFRNFIASGKPIDTWKRTINPAKKPTLYKAYQFAQDIFKFEEKIAINASGKDGPDDVFIDITELAKLKDNFKFIWRKGVPEGKIEWLFDQNEQNAMKIHEFLKGVADKHLGKTYLVKIPKSANLNYLGNTLHLEENLRYKGLGGFIDDGPYGFPAVPIDGRPYPLAPNKKAIKYPYLDEDYNNSNLSWNNGALRTNFNPINKQWEHSYEPESAGGYFDINLWSGNAKNLGLYPIDSAPFEDEGRISAYVRFPYGEFLDFSEIDNESISYVPFSLIATPFLQGPQGERFYNEHYYSPSLSIRNTVIDTRTVGIPFTVGTSYTSDLRAGDLMAEARGFVFVKCEISDKLVHTPRVIKRQTKVFGDNLIFRKSREQLSKIPLLPNNSLKLDGQLLFPGKKFQKGSKNESTNVFTEGESFHEVFREPDDAHGGYIGNTVLVDDFERSFNGSEPFKKTVYDENGAKKMQNALGPAETFLVKREYLSSNHVYALITLPGKVTKKPTISNRIQVQLTATSIELSESTVPRHVAGLEKLPVKNYIDGKYIVKLELDEHDLGKSKDLSDPEAAIGFESKPPITPELAVLPLLSNERCYGPWVSASKIDNSVNRYSDIGGKVEYVKDENLSPWNYGGYAELQQAGVLKAQFSNSLLLFGEKGSFTFPGAPAGLTIAQPLMSVRGPLVTSINVNVGDSVKTTVSMDSFSPNFGKLKKQQEEQLADLAKEKRRMIDERNRQIRQAGIKKTQRFAVVTRGDTTRVVNLGNPLMKQKTAQTTLSASSFKLETLENANDDLLISMLGENSSFLNGDEPLASSINYYNSASLTDNKNFIGLSAGLKNNTNKYNELLKKTGTENLNNFIVPFDHQPDNPNMANFDYISKYSINRRTN